MTCWNLALRKIKNYTTTTTDSCCIFSTWGVNFHRYFEFQAFYRSCMFLKDIRFWTANIISGRRVVCIHQIRSGLPLLSSEKNKGNAGNSFFICPKYILWSKFDSSPESSKWESNKSNAVSESCFAKQLFKIWAVK